MSSVGKSLHSILQLKEYGVSKSLFRNYETKREQEEEVTCLTLLQKLFFVNRFRGVTQFLYFFHVNLEVDADFFTKKQNSRQIICSIMTF